jgi:hypothetical protein
MFTIKSSILELAKDDEHINQLDLRIQIKWFKDLLGNLSTSAPTDTG